MCHSTQQYVLQGFSISFSQNQDTHSVSKVLFRKLQKKWSVHKTGLVNLFHGTLLVVIITIESGKVVHVIIILIGIVIINGQSKFHQTVNA